MNKSIRVESSDETDVNHCRKPRPLMFASNQDAVVFFTWQKAGDGRTYAKDRQVRFSLFLRLAVGGAVASLASR